MKATILCLFLSCIIITGCNNATLNGPPVISKVELNTDSIRTGLLGTYRVYLKSEKGSDPVFYSYLPYKSGEALVPMSNLQLMIDSKVNACLDTIRMKNFRIEKLEREKEIMERQIDEKNLLIRFLTGK